MSQRYKSFSTNQNYSNVDSDQKYGFFIFYVAMVI